MPDVPRDPVPTGDGVTRDLAVAGHEGRRLSGRYALRELVGRGGMGDVYRAEDLLLGRPVAVKALRSGMPVDPRSLARFQREARAVAAFDHPGLVKIFDVLQDGYGPYIVMELVEGRSLEEVLRAEGAPTVSRAVEIAREISDAIEVAHRGGVIHRDLKPANVMITDDGRVKILDFGIAWALRWTPLTGGSVVQGTAEYVSPEQVRGEPSGPRSDVYSLGILLYEMLTNRPPFVSDSPAGILYKHLEASPPPPSSLCSEIPTELDRIVLRCLEKEPGARFESARELGRALREVRVAASISDDVQGAPRSLTRTGRLGRVSPTTPLLRRSWRAVLIAASIGAALAAGAFIPNLLGGGGAANARPRLPALTPPTGLALTSKCSGFATSTADLRWAASGTPEVDGYAVYRSREGDPYEEVATLPGRATIELVDAHLETGTTYHYRIRATSGPRAGTYSETAAIGTPVLCLW